MPALSLTPEQTTQLAQLSDEIRTAQTHYDLLRQQRHDLVVSYVKQGVTRQEIAKACRLSPQRVSKIADGNAPPAAKRRLSSAA